MKPFWDLVDTTADGCWAWTGYRSSRTGYGQASVGGKTRSAHRLAYEITYGPIPDGMLVCHHCDNRACVRPEHLFLGTQKDNIADAVRKGRMSAGARNGRAKLTEAQVRQMRERYAAGGISYPQLAAEFGVTHNAAWRTVQRLAWKAVA